MTPPVLETRRLTLRPITIDDAADITRGLSNWDVIQWLTGPPFPYALADAHAFITDVVPLSPMWAIDAGDGLIGVIGLHPDLGFWLDVDYHGQRIMTEAASAVVAWHFEQQATSLMSCHHLGNDASRAVLRKLGFSDCGTETHLQKSTQENVAVKRMVLDQSTWDAR